MASRQSTTTKLEDSPLTPALSPDAGEREISVLDLIHLIHLIHLR